MITHEEIIGALQKRYATKKFDPSKKVSERDFETILESGHLAPSSFGLEPWKFIVVENPAIRAQLRAAAYDQPQLTDASHLIVIAQRTDAAALVSELVARTSAARGKTEEELAGLRQMIEGSIAGKDAAAVQEWLKAQTYIPLGVMLSTAALLGVDTTPMEGFDSVKVDEILKLKEKNLKSVTMLAVGYRAGDDAFASLQKVRRSKDAVVETVRE